MRMRAAARKPRVAARALREWTHGLRAWMRGYAQLRARCGTRKCRTLTVGAGMLTYGRGVRAFEGIEWAMRIHVYTAVYSPRGPRSLGAGASGPDLVLGAPGSSHDCRLAVSPSGFLFVFSLPGRCTLRN